MDRFIAARLEAEGLRPNSSADRRTLIRRATYDLIGRIIDPQPKHETNVRKYRRYHSLARAIAPLAEGVTPPGKRLTFTDITATLEQYGDLVELTDRIYDLHEDMKGNRLVDEVSDIMGEQAAETIEVMRFNVLKAGTTVFYANGVNSRGSVNSAPTRGDFRKIYRFFKKNKAREISRIISATPNVATEPVGAAYFAIGHTDLDADLRGISGFVPVEKYSDSMKALPGEVGKIENFRIVLTPLFEPWEAAGTSGTTFLANGAVPSTSTKADVYPLIFVARDAYGIVPLQGSRSVSVTVLNPTPDKSDPLGQRGFASWKTMQTAVILNEQWIARLECAATASPN